MNKNELSERDICTNIITPDIEKLGWDIHSQVREEVRWSGMIGQVE